MRDSPALVAYEQSNGTYDVHRSDRLGRALHHAWRITEVTPFGYSTCDEESVVIKPAVLERRLSIQELVDQLDYAAFGAVVVVSETYTVTPYRALWFGFENACRRVHVSERIGNGALVNLPDLHGAPHTDATFCARYTAVKRTLGGLIDDGRLSRADADRHLRTSRSSTTTTTSGSRLERSRVMPTPSRSRRQHPSWTDCSAGSEVAGARWSVAVLRRL